MAKRKTLKKITVFNGDTHSDEYIDLLDRLEAQRRRNTHAIKPKTHKSKKTYTRKVKHKKSFNY